MKVYKETVKKYYKYTNWTQPVLSSNGALGGNSFAVSFPNGVYSTAYEPYLAFDGNNNTYAIGVGGDNTMPMIIYNPTPLNITNISMVKYSGYNFTSIGIYGSNNNSTWEQIQTIQTSSGTDFSWNISNSKYYKYYKISPLTGTQGRFEIIEMNITATQMVESDESNYNTYEYVDVYKLPTAITTKYFKWDSPNVTVEGSPTINNGVVSGFSASNYLSLPATLINPSQSWEIVLKVTTPASATGNQVLFEFSNGTGWRAISVYYALNVKKFGYCLTSSTSSNTILSDKAGANAISYSTTYWLKLTYDGINAYKGFLSTDGETWKSEFSVTSTEKIYQGTLCTLAHYRPSTGLYWQGTIDLRGCYIKRDADVIWQGMTYKAGTSTNYDFLKDVNTYYGIGD